MLVVLIIMFGVSLVLGLLWKRGLLSLLMTTFVISAGFGIYMGNWAFLFPLSSLWRNLIYTTVTMAGYFVFFIPPAIFGAVLGNMVRSNFRKK